MNEGKQCLKCGYSRAEDDPPPSSQCPKCGAIYAKVEAHQAHQAQAADERPARPKPEPTNKPSKLKRAGIYGGAIIALAVVTELLPDRRQVATESQSAAASTTTTEEPLDTEEALRNIEYIVTHATIHAKQICTDDWTKRGVLDTRMYNHCLEQQIEAMRDLEYLIAENNTSRYYTLSLFHCRREWTDHGIVNPRMVRHCLEQEVEAWKDIDYYKTIYDRELIEELAHQGMMRYRSWRMAAYHMKAALDR
uniref:hypothetical protein n=1 Tax=Marinobacterium profundum TaxID=1714300 RepID=UPI00082DE5AF|nr:hypothetical protein [Marinobacterium profundum]